MAEKKLLDIKREIDFARRQENINEDGSYKHQSEE